MRLGEKHVGLWLDPDTWESENRPWFLPPKFGEEASALVGDGLASLKPGQFFLAPCGQHLGTGDALDKLESKVNAEIVKGQPHMVGKKALRSSMLYIQKDERGNKCRKRGVGNANDVEKFMVFNEGKFQLFNLKKKQRLNGIGTTHSMSIKNMRNSVRHTLPEMAPDDKQAIWRNANLSTVDKEVIAKFRAGDKATKKACRGMKAFVGCLKSNFHARDSDVTAEVAHALDLQEFFDLKLRDCQTMKGCATYIASKHAHPNFQFFGLIASDLLEQFLLKELDQFCIKLMVESTEGYFAQDQETKKQLQELFGNVMQSAEEADEFEDDDSDDGGEDD